LFPPAITVTGHGFPVVSGETPVLAGHREIVGRSSRLAIHVVKSRIHPGIHTVAVYSDGNIPLEHHPFGTGIFGSITKLAMCMVLYEIVDGNIIIVRCFWIGNFVEQGSRQPGESVPPCIIRGIEKIPQIGKCSIGSQPGFIIPVKSAEVGILKEFCLLLIVNKLEKTGLEGHHCFIIHLFKRIEISSLRFDDLSGNGRVEISDLDQVNIDGMQGKYRNRRIRIGILPGMKRHGIVHRKDLDHPDPCGSSPVDQQPEI